MSLITVLGLHKKKNKVKSNRSSVSFELDSVEEFQRLKSYIVDLSNIDNEKCMFLFNSINDGYRVYLGPEIFDKKLLNLRQILSSICTESWSTTKTNYFVVTSKDLIKYESQIFELVILFRFSGLIGLRNDATIEQLQHISKKWSWHSIFSITRWESQSNWFLFFDGEHLTGDYQTI